LLSRVVLPLVVLYMLRVSPVLVLFMLSMFVVMPLRLLLCVLHFLLFVCDIVVDVCGVGGVAYGDDVDVVFVFAASGVDVVVCGVVVVVYVVV